MKVFGYQLLTTDLDCITIEHKSVPEEFQVLAVTPFNYEIKMSRALIKKEDSSYAVFYIRGSYSMVSPLLSLAGEERGALEYYHEELLDRGLLCMVMAYKIIDHKTL